MKGYRKGDLDNGGYGVLVSYDLDRRQRPAASAPQPQAAGLARDVVKAKVREAVGGLLGADRAGAFEAGRPFMEMGLESLDLLTLRRMLSEAMGEPLDSSFFFRHSTPDAVVRYFTKEEAPRRDEGSRRRLRRPKAQATAGAMDGEGYAIVGMAGRFPGAPSVADFWALLAAGKEGVGEISPRALAPVRGGAHGPGGSATPGRPADGCRPLRRRLLPYRTARGGLARPAAAPAAGGRLARIGRRRSAAGWSGGQLDRLLRRPDGP